MFFIVRLQWGVVVVIGFETAFASFAKRDVNILSILILL
jgi:hypothetical protein